MRSLRIKFSALVVTLLVVACVALAVIATQHERAALENEAEKRARALVINLAGSVKESLLEVEQGDFDGELTLDRLIQEAGEAEGVVAVRVLDLDGRVAASLSAEDRNSLGTRLSGDVDDPDSADLIVRRGARLLVAAPIVYSDVPIGEAQVDLDLSVIVDPVVRSNTRQLAFAAIVVIILGVAAGMIFVALLVGPLRRLRQGVEQLKSGDLTVRVPPTSGDEVGSLTRAFNEMGDSLLEKQRIQSAFGRYVNDYVLNQLIEGQDDQKDGMEREVTILFADIRRFTRLSEGMEAPAVVSLLNEIFQLASDHILERGGTIDKFIGDSVMAYFGAPVPHPDHAQRAVLAAMDISRIIEERNQRCRGLDPGAPSLVPVEIGIGIHTGTVVVGNIGSDRRTDFTAVGDAVNVAHRLEKLARPGEILVSEAVQRRVRTFATLQFEGERQLSGREEPVHVYSVDIDYKRPQSDVPRPPSENG
jgi:adenylate cyclase